MMPFIIPIASYILPGIERFKWISLYI